MSLLLGVCGGFLMAVLWFDLMFDVQVLKYRNSEAELPEEVLSSIAGYYRRVTTEARPMNLLVAAVMLVAVGASIAQLAAASAPQWVGAASLLLSGAPIVLARMRVIGNAMRLGSRRDNTAVQSELARGICRDHLVCFASILLFTGLQFASIVGG